MKNIKSIFVVALLLSLFSLPSIANPVTPRADIIAGLTTVRAEVSKVMENNSFRDLGLDVAEVRLKFKVNRRGQLEIVEMNSESRELLSMVQEKLQHYRIEDAVVPVDMLFHLKLKFELR